MLTARTFPTIIIALDLAAAVMYGLEGLHQWRMVGYWFSAAVLTFCVTY